MIGKCYVNPDRHKCIILRKNEETGYGGIVIFREPEKLNDYRSTYSRIAQFDGWTFHRYDEIPKEEFLKEYRQAIQEQILSIEAVL